jgi:hypothetical protein
MMTPEEIEKYDKHRAAVHEAGHAVVAFEYGVSVTAWLERTDTMDQVEEKTWVGHVCGFIHGEAGKFVAVAGVVAVCSQDDPEVSADEIVDCWQAGIIAPSSTDLEFVPASWDIRLEAVKVALGIISKQREFHVRIVSELVNHEIVTNGEMKALARQLFVDSDS